MQIETMIPPPQLAAPTDRDPLTSRIRPGTMLAILVVGAVLHFGSEVFLPLAIATLIAFALSPLVSVLRNRGLPLIVAVLAVVTVAFALLGLFLLILGAQFATLLQSLPTFQSNILAKLEALQSAGSPSGVVGQLADMLARINGQISAALQLGQEAAAGTPAQGTTAAPLAVELVEHRGVLSIVQDLILPIISPVVTAGLVIVVVIFMLLERANLRDRFIRLVGSSDLHRTTVMLEDAGARVASYLLVQLLVNVIYALPIGIGLWIIGVPNPILWASLTLVLRFVPYIGSALAATLPLSVAFAVSPDWSMVLWTAALFGAVEMITSNIIEPWLYGSRTGLSPLAIIVAAIIWTWIWGPAGLILSTPLTVCLVVLGRHLPQFEVFHILFGDEAVLVPHAQLYQQLLSGAAMDSAARAEEDLEDTYLADYYQTVCIPALLLAQGDLDRGVLTPTQEDRIAGSAKSLMQSLDDVVAEELEEAARTADDATAPLPEDAAAGITGGGAVVAVVGGRSKLDDVAAAMLGQAMVAEGAEVTVLGRADLMTFGRSVAERRPGQVSPTCLLLNFLDVAPARASLLVIRRLKRAVPGLRVGVVFWQMPDQLTQPTDTARSLTPLAAKARSEAEAIGADFVVTSVEAAMAAAFSTDAAKPLAATPPGLARRPARRRLSVVAA